MILGVSDFQGRGLSKRRRRHTNPVAVVSDTFELVQKTNATYALREKLVRQWKTVRLALNTSSKETNEIGTALWRVSSRRESGMLISFCGGQVVHLSASCLIAPCPTRIRHTAL